MTLQNFYENTRHQWTTMGANKIACAFMGIPLANGNLLHWYCLIQYFVCLHLFFYSFIIHNWAHCHSYVWVCPCVLEYTKNLLFFSWWMEFQILCFRFWTGFWFIASAKRLIRWIPFLFSSFSLFVSFWLEIIFRGDCYA